MKRMSALAAVAFDLDDTLYPERDFVRSGYRAVAEWAETHLGLAAPIVQAELDALFAAGLRREVFSLWLEERGLDPARWVETMVAVYREHSPRISMFADAAALLEVLESHGVRRGVITEGYRAVQESKLRALGLAEAFEVVVIGGEEVRQRWKPSRAPFEEWLSRMKVNAQESCYIGDNPAKDFRGAREVGMHTMRVRRAEGLHAQEEPPTPGDEPEVEVLDLDEAAHILLPGAA
jgi:putative hydrolase of the HAD superfamily